MTDLDKALAALREARDENASIGHEPVSWFLVDAALAALDEARGAAVAYVGDAGPVTEADFAAPPASPCVCGEPALGVVHRADGPCYLPEQAPPAAAVPEGYALVPVEPTPEMIAAGWFGGEMHIALGHANAYRECEGDYARLLAAAARKGE